MKKKEECKNKIKGGEKNGIIQKKNDGKWKMEKDNNMALKKKKEYQLPVKLLEVLDQKLHYTKAFFKLIQSFAFKKKDILIIN